MCQASLGDKKQELEKFSGPSINRMSENLEKRLRQNSENLDRKIDSLSEDMAKKFDYISEVVEKTSEKSSMFQRSTESIDRKLEQFSTSIDRKLDSLAQDIGTRVHAAISSSPADSEKALETVEKRLQSIDENLEKSVLKASENLDKKLQAISDSLDKKLQIATDKLGPRAVEGITRDQHQQTQTQQPIPKFPFGGSTMSGDTGGSVSAGRSGQLSLQRQNFAPQGQSIRMGLESSVQFDAIMTAIKQLSDNIDKKIDRRIDERLGIDASSSSSQSSSQKSRDTSRAAPTESANPSSIQNSTQTAATTSEAKAVADSKKTRSAETVEKRSNAMRTRPGDKFLRDPTYIGLWLLAIATYGVGDLATTYFALNRVPPLTEINPIVGLFGNFLNFFIAKVVIIIGIFLVSYLTLDKKSEAYSVPSAITVFGVILGINNMIGMGWI